MSSIMSTMCVCGQTQIMDLLGARNLFVEHDDPRTGQRCPGVPQPEYRAVHYQAIIDGVIYRPTDMITDANGEVWKAYPGRSAFGNPMIQWKTFGDLSAGSPRRPLRRLLDLTDTLVAIEVARRTAESDLVRHSVFAYPHFLLWHLLFDGTRLCGCWHSRQMRDGPAKIPVRRTRHSQECKIKDYPTCTDDCYNRQTELNPGLPREHS